MLTKDGFDSVDVNSFLLSNDTDIVVEANRKAFSSELSIGEIGASLSEKYWLVMIMTKCNSDRPTDRD